MCLAGWIKVGLWNVGSSHILFLYSNAISGFLRVELCVSGVDELLE